MATTTIGIGNITDTSDDYYSQQSIRNIQKLLQELNIQLKGH